MPVLPMRPFSAGTGGVAPPWTPAPATAPDTAPPYVPTPTYASVPPPATAPPGYATEPYGGNDTSMYGTLTDPSYAESAPIQPWYESARPLPEQSLLPAVSEPPEYDWTGYDDREQIFQAMDYGMRMDGGRGMRPPVNVQRPQGIPLPFEVPFFPDIATPPIATPPTPSPPGWLTELTALNTRQPMSELTRWQRLHGLFGSTDAH